MKTRRWITWLILIGIAALILRLIYVAELRDSPLFAVVIGDARQYDSWAQQIAAGNWVGTEVFYQTPLYPYFLAVVFKIGGHDLLTVRLLQAVLGALSCVMLGLAARKFFNERVGLLAAALLAIYPPAIFFDALIQKSALDLLFMTALLALLGEFLNQSQRRWLVAAGLTLGLLMLNRENARILYPCILIWLLIYFRDRSWSTRLGWAGIFTAALLLVVLPVGLRNYHVGGELLISTSQLGPNLYIGNHSGAQGSYEPLVPEHGSAAYEREDAIRLAEAALGRKLSAGEVSDYWVRQSTEFIRREPLVWLRLMGKKLLLTISAREAVDTESLEAYSEYSYLQKLLGWLSFGVILPLAVFGLWHTRNDWRRLAVLYAMMLALVFAVAIFYVLARYRYPLVPIVIMFAAAALAAIPALLRGPRREWAIGLALAIIVGLPSNLLFMQSHDDVTFLNVGEEFVRMGDPAAAIPLLRKAVAASPTYAPVHFNLAVALNQHGDKAQAIEEFANAIRLQPDYFEAHAALGLTLQETSKPAEALDHFREAVRLRPLIAEAHTNLGNALAQSGKPDEAVLQYREGLRLEPNNAITHNGLAVVLQQQGKTQEAIKECTEALRLKPDFAGAHSNLALSLAASGNQDGAIDHLREAVRLEPNNAGMHMNLADLLSDKGRIDDAIIEYQAAVKLRPGLLEAHYRLGQLYARASRLNEAVSSFEQALILAQSAQRPDEIRQIEEAIHTCRAAMN